MRYSNPAENQLANYGPPPPMQQNYGPPPPMQQYQQYGNGNYMPMQPPNGYPQQDNKQMYEYQDGGSLKHKLEGIEGVVVKQKFHLMEALVNIEQANNYAVYRKKPGTSKKKNERQNF